MKSFKKKIFINLKILSLKSNADIFKYLAISTYLNKRKLINFGIKYFDFSILLFIVPKSLYFLEIICSL